MLNELRAVIFDWAGTLVDYGAYAPVDAFVSVFAAEGVPLAAAEARLPMGLSKMDHISQVLALPGVSARWRAAKGRDPSKADLDRLFAALEPAFLDAVPHHLDVIPGAVGLVRNLRRWGVKVGATTGYSRRAMEPVLAGVASQGLEVQTVVCSGETPLGRPTSAQMDEVLRRLGVDEPFRCVKIDDTASGLQEGLDCGAWVVGVTMSGNAAGLTWQENESGSAEKLLAVRRAAEERLDGVGAHYLCDSIADLPQILHEIARRIAHGERP